MTLAKREKIHCTGSQRSWNLIHIELFDLRTDAYKPLF